jgi:hypothetical protein
MTTIKTSIFISFLYYFCFTSSVQNGKKLENAKKIQLTLQLLKIGDSSIIISGPTDDPDPNIKIVIKNNTDTCATFYEAWNSWGHDAFQLEITKGDTVFILFRDSGCDPTKNYPSAVMLFPGDSLIFYLKVRHCFKGICSCFLTTRGIKFPTDNLLGSKIRAIYQVNKEGLQADISIQLESPPWARDFISLKNESHIDKFSKFTFE